MNPRPWPSYEAAETSLDHSITLELSENDIFCQEKKKLLKSKGFSPRECVCLRNSTSPTSMSDAAQTLLQIARIINLNELELYFAEGDASSPVEIYSHRNELEALSSILSLLDISFASCMPMQMNLLQEFRETILHLISDFGYKNSFKSTIERQQKCDKEECLVEWGESNGLRTRLQIAYVKGASRGAIAREDLNVGDIALEIPISIIISEELLQESDIYHVLKDIDSMSSETMLLLWSMKEKHNSNSRFNLYFESLPEKFNTGLSFGVDAITTLDGTLLLEEIMQAREHLYAQYTELFPALCDDYPDAFPLEIYTWENFVWACELWYSNSMKIMFSDGTFKTCLVPIASFLNHSLLPHIAHYGKVDSGTNSLKFSLSRPCRAGEECYLSYGNFSSSHLITFYGFLPPGDNPYDVIPLDIDSPEIESMSCWTTHMVRGTWLSKNHNIFYYGLPSPLLEHLRISRNPLLQTETLLQASLENEVELLEDLCEIFNGMMENLGEDIMERENPSWDVKLALDYKTLQRHIVSSILTSCNSGLKLVINELCKCMDEDIRG